MQNANSKRAISPSHLLAEKAGARNAGHSGEVIDFVLKKASLALAGSLWNTVGNGPNHHTTVSG